MKFCFILEDNKLDFYMNSSNILLIGAEIKTQIIFQLIFQKNFAIIVIIIILY